MLDLDESFARLAADALGGRIGRNQLGVLLFQSFQLVHQLVKFGVGDFGSVEHVVEVLVVADLFAEGVDLFVERGHYGEIIVWAQRPQVRYSSIAVRATDARGCGQRIANDDSGEPTLATVFL